MSLYRQAGGSRTRVIVIATVAALVAGIAGYLIGRGTAPDATLEELVAEARAEARPALSSLELVDIEYAQETGAGGERAEEGSGAALEHAQAAAAAIEDASGLAEVNPDGVEAARAAVASVEDAIQAQEPATEVKRLVADARDAVAGLSGDGAP